MKPEELRTKGIHQAEFGELRDGGAAREGRREGDNAGSKMNDIMRAVHMENAKRSIQHFVRNH